MLLSKTMQITRYKIEIKDKVEFTNTIKSKLEESVSFNIDDTPDEIMIGVADHQDNFTTNFDKIHVNDYVIFTMRIDEKKVNKHILEKQLSEYIQQNYSNQELIPSQKKEFKQIIYDKLLYETKAIPKCFDIVIDVSNEIAYLFSTNKKANEEFESLMYKFGIPCICLFPFTMAENYYTESEIINRI